MLKRLDAACLTYHLSFRDKNDSAEVHLSSRSEGNALIKKRHSKLREKYLFYLNEILPCSLKFLSSVITWSSLKYTHSYETECTVVFQFLIAKVAVCALSRRSYCWSSSARKEHLLSVQRRKNRRDRKWGLNPFRAYRSYVWISIPRKPWRFVPMAMNTRTFPSRISTRATFCGAIFAAATIVLSMVRCTRSGSMTPSHSWNRNYSRYKWYPWCFWGRVASTIRPHDSHISQMSDDNEKAKAVWSGGDRQVIALQSVPEAARILTTNSFWVSLANCDVL